MIQRVEHKTTEPENYHNFVKFKEFEITGKIDTASQKDTYIFKFSSSDQKCTKRGYSDCNTLGRKGAFKFKITEQNF